MPQGWLWHQCFCTSRHRKIPCLIVCAPPGPLVATPRLVAAMSFLLIDRLCRIIETNKCEVSQPRNDGPVFITEPTGHNIRCDQAQGYRLARPLSADALESLLQRPELTRQRPVTGALCLWRTTPRYRYCRRSRMLRRTEHRRMTLNPARRHCMGRCLVPCPGGLGGQRAAGRARKVARL